MDARAEALRSTHIRVLASLKEVERENAELKRKLLDYEKTAGLTNAASGRPQRMVPEELDALYVEEQRQIESLQKEVAELRATLREGRKGRDAELASALELQARKAREVQELKSEIQSSSQKAAQQLTEARVAFEEELGARAAECEALRLSVSELEQGLELANLRNGAVIIELRRAENQLAITNAKEAEAAERARRAEHALREMRVCETSPSDADEELAAAAEDAKAAELERLRNALQLAETVSTHATAEAEGAHAEAAERARAEAERTRRERLKLERELAGANQALAVTETRALEAASTAKKSAEAVQAGLERECGLERELAEARRQLVAGAGAGSRSNFQEFVALKREIANLRSTNAALSRQVSGSAGVPPESLTNILGRHTERDAGVSKQLTTGSLSASSRVGRTRVLQR